MNLIKILSVLLCRTILNKMKETISKMPENQVFGMINCSNCSCDKKKDCCKKYKKKGVHCKKCPKV